MLALTVVGVLTGHRALVDRGDSMRPALRAGDLLINRSVAAEQLGVGDIVTFDDPTRDRSVTHRVVTRRVVGPRVDFVTRGDANSGGERWSAGRGEDLGRVVASIPGAGHVVGFLVGPPVRLLLTVVCAIVLGVVALRWIWRDDLRQSPLKPRVDPADNRERSGARPAARPE